MPKNRPPKPTNGPPPATGRPEPTGCYVMSLTLENVRCFGPKQTLDLSHPKDKTRPAQWTIILGENGTGKTTLLQSLVGSEMLPHPLVPAEWGLRHPRLEQYHRSDPRNTCRTGSVLATIEVVLGVAESISSPVRIAQGPRFRMAPQGLFEIHVGDEAYGLPWYCAYGVDRWSVETSHVGTGVSDDRTESLFTERGTLRNPEDWLLALDYAASKGSGSDSHVRREAVLQLLTNGVLPEVTAIQFDSGSGPYPRPKVEFKTPYGWVPLRQLGYGYQTLIAWMLDFVSRMVERYPDSPDPLKEPAVVVVDEIDLHLHPKWQRQLIGFLSERFPNTQFIATAHSPLVVQAAEDANIAVLRRNDGDDFVTIVNDVDAIRGWRVDQILTSDLFGLESARDPETERLILRQQELTEKRKRTAKDERELAEIAAKLNGASVGETADDVADMAALRKALHALHQPTG